MHVCPRCGGLVEDVPVIGEGAVVTVSTYAAEEAAAAQPPPQPDYVPVSVPEATSLEASRYRAPPAEAAAVWTPPPTPIAVRRRRRLGRFLAIGLVAGLLVAAALVALEAVAPGLRSTSVELHGLEYPDTGFSIAVPVRWTQSETNTDDVVIEDRSSIERDGGRRGLRVSIRDRTLAHVRSHEGADDQGGEVNQNVRIDTREALRRTFTKSAEFRDEWWVDNGDTTFYIEFWAPVSAGDDVTILNERIAQTFHVL